MAVTLAQAVEMGLWAQDAVQAAIRRHIFGLSSEASEDDEYTKRLRDLAESHGGNLLVIPLSEYDETHLMVIEWLVTPHRVAGGEGRGATQKQAAKQLLLSLHGAGLI